MYVYIYIYINVCIYIHTLIFESHKKDQKITKSIRTS